MHKGLISQVLYISWLYFPTRVQMPFPGLYACISSGFLSTDMWANADSRPDLCDCTWEKAVWLWALQGSTGWRPLSWGQGDRFCSSFMSIDTSLLGSDGPRKPKEPWKGHMELCPARGQDKKTNENPGLSTGWVSSCAHFPRTLISEAGQWLFGRFHTNVKSGTDIPSMSQLQYQSPLRLSKWSACHSFPCIINASTTVLCFYHDTLTSQENKDYISIAGFAK